jgi:putative DNA methylase
LFNPDKLPAFHDPFAGGGSLPLEAQRLGLEAYASDLNPVAVLINKAMIEIPPKFAGQPPVNPESGKQQALGSSEWKGAEGLAEDVRDSGKWLRAAAEKRIGHLYPKVEITEEMAKERPDLEQYVGQKLTVIAWLWARTVKSPNPAFKHVDVPLASTFMLSTKKGKEAYVEPVIEGDSYRFTVKMGEPDNVEVVKKGTKAAGKKSGFNCLLSGVPMPFDYIRKEASSDRMSERLMAIVAEGNRGRVYLSPISEMEDVVQQAEPTWMPDTETCGKCRVNVGLYGMTTWDKLFTPRQLVALTTFSDLVLEAREQVRHDALAIGMSANDQTLDNGGTKAQAYADAVAVYHGLATSRWSDLSNSLCSWNSTNQNVRALFARQAIPMNWDFVELSPFSKMGSWFSTVVSSVKLSTSLSTEHLGFATQADSRMLSYQQV